LPSRVTLDATRRLIEGTERASRLRPSPRHIARAVATVSRRIPHASCLTQALAAQLLLRVFGYRARVCVGVGRQPTGAFTAHAWVERDGQVLIGANGSVALTRLELPHASSSASTAECR